MLALKQPGCSLHFSGTQFLYSCVNVSDALSLLWGCTPAASHEPGQKLPDWNKYAWPLVSVLLPSIRDARARDAVPAGGSSPAPPPRPDPLPSNRPPATAALGEADGAELPPRGKGCFSAGVPPAGGCSRQPPWKGYSWLFYKYIYIFFVARYCYLMLVLGAGAEPSEDALASLNGARPGSPCAVPGAQQHPGVSHPGAGSALGVPLPQPSPAVVLPVPVAVSTAKLYTLSFF